MATHRLRPIFLFLVLALLLTTTACRGAPTGAAGRPPRLQAVAGARGPSAQRPATWVPPLVRPLRVTRPFEPPPTPFAAGHRGVDLAGSPGQPVVAAGSGTVSWAGVLAGRGVVVVQHGSLRTTYEPVAADVARGDRVLAGNRIGSLRPGHPGCPAAACLHWGLLRGRQYLDPMSLIRTTIRLLPLGDR